MSIDKALLLRTRHLVLDFELQFGPSSQNLAELGNKIDLS